jgi:hypothetical protein
MSRKANSTKNNNQPLVRVQRFDSIQCQVDTRQIEELSSYIDYVNSVTRMKPTEGEVISAALEHLFKLDEGYQQWKEGSHRPDGRLQRPSDVAASY